MNPNLTYDSPTKCAGAITPSSRWLKVLSEDGAQGLIRTPFNSIAAVRKSVRCWWSKRLGADMAGNPAYDPGCVKTRAAKILLMILRGN
jgi:hypothetical protein